MGKENLECDWCFKKVKDVKELRKVRNIKLWKCKECQEATRKPKFSWYLPNELLQVTTGSGAKLVGVKSSQGEFIALNKVLDEFIQPYKKAVEFVCHIKDHLDNDPKFKDLKSKDVKCGICKKTIDEIWDEYTKEDKKKKEEDKKSS